jgi:cysteinyl-tRNA synthetase
MGYALVRVNYFLHSGHLSIEGLKMSKSLKNFISIRFGITLDGASHTRQETQPRTYMTLCWQCHSIEKNVDCAESCNWHVTALTAAREWLEKRIQGHVWAGCIVS